MQLESLFFLRPFFTTKDTKNTKCLIGHRGHRDHRELLLNSICESFVENNDKPFCLPHAHDGSRLIPPPGYRAAL